MREPLRSLRRNSTIDIPFPARSSRCQWLALRSRCAAFSPDLGGGTVQPHGRCPDFSPLLPLIATLCVHARLAVLVNPCSPESSECEVVPPASPPSPVRVPQFRLRRTAFFTSGCTARERTCARCTSAYCFVLLARGLAAPGLVAARRVFLAGLPMDRACVLPPGRNATSVPTGPARVVFSPDLHCPQSAATCSYNCRCCSLLR